MLRGFWNDMKEWFLETAKVLRREFGLVLSSPGTLLFFFALPLAYPIIYATIYNTEVTRDMPVAVVDNCRSAESREFVRHADATQAIKICGYASNMGEAKRWWEEKKCYGILEIPADYSRRTYRGEQGVINFYSDMSLLLRYRTFLESLTSLQMATDADLRTMAMNTLGISAPGQESGVETESFFLGDPEQGIRFVHPAGHRCAYHAAEHVAWHHIPFRSIRRPQTPSRRCGSGSYCGISVGNSHRESPMLCDDLYPAVHLHPPLYPRVVRLTPHRQHVAGHPVYVPASDCLGNAGADIADYGD